MKIKEEQLSELIAESIKKVLNEYRDWKSYRKAEDEPFIQRMNQFAQKYGYEPYQYKRSQGYPEQYAKSMIQRHNTFLRGVNTNDMSDEMRNYAIQQLRQRGITNPTEEQLAQFAATTPIQGRGGNYVSTMGNADVYGAGGTNGKFAGTAKVVRPYSLGSDRMKWFDEGDFNVRGASDYDTNGGNMTSQEAVTRQIQPGEVVDTWDNGTSSNSELQLGGGTNFGGWVTDKERAKSYNADTKRNKRARETMKRVAAQRAAGLPVSKQQQRWEKDLDPNNGYENWLTSRNNYKR